MRVMSGPLALKTAPHLPLSIALAVVAVAVPAPAMADPLPYGPDTCVNGYVWREAFDGDTICVTPAVRSATLADNAAAPSRKATNTPQPTPLTNTVVFEVTGSGEVFNIVTDPDTGFVPDHTTLPYKRTTTIGSDVHLLQVVATGRNDPGPGCRITLNGKVVSEEPLGGNAHCIYSLP